jgi:protein SCO1/2
VALAAGVLVSTPALAQINQLPPQARGLEIDEKVGQPLPLELAFTNSEGKLVQLREYFSDNKPAIVALVYYDCPVVCDVMLQKIAETLNDLDLTVGKDFRVLIFSFDPTETVAQAAGLRAMYLAGYNREVTPEVAAGWQFHVTDTSATRQLANSMGFPYRLLDDGEYSHPVALFIVSPEGVQSRNIYGFNYPARDVKLSLIDASGGKLARSIGDRIMAFCYMYDPQAGAYTLQAMRVMQVAGGITVVSLGTLIGLLFLGERIRRRLMQSSGNSSGAAGAGGPTIVTTAGAASGVRA